MFEKHSGRCDAGPCVGESLKALPLVVAGGDVRTGEAFDIDALATRYW